MRRFMMLPTLFGWGCCPFRPRARRHPPRRTAPSMISIIEVLLMKELGHQIRDFEVVKI